MRAGLKLVLITVPVVVAGALVLGNIVSSKKPPARVEITERATVVRVIETKVTEVAPTLTGYGLVAPSRTFDAIAQVGGTAEYVNPAMRKGEIIPEGTVLLRLSTEDFNLAIAQARANIRAAEAKLAELAVSEENQHAALEIEQEALVLKTTDLERSESLFASQTISQTVLDGARAAHLAQRQKVLNVQSTLALLPTQRAAQNEQIAVYQANLASAELSLARSELTLPFTGRVSAVTVDEGQFVKVGQTVASFDGIGSAEVEAQVSVADLSVLLLGAREEAGMSMFNPETMSEVLQELSIQSVVRLQLGDDYVDWPAELVRISNTIDQKSGTLGVIVQVENAYFSAAQGSRPPLTKGMFVEVTLSGPPIEGIVIPRAALDVDRVLLADSESRLQTHTVQPYLIQGDIALITEGLEAGSLVLASRPRPVIPGMLLDVVRDEALMEALAGAAQ